MKIKNLYNHLIITDPGSAVTDGIVSISFDGVSDGSMVSVKEHSNGRRNIGDFAVKNGRISFPIVKPSLYTIQIKGMDSVARFSTYGLNGAKETYVQRFHEAPGAEYEAIIALLLKLSDHIKSVEAKADSLSGYQTE